MFTVRACPCGSGSSYDDCCGPLHRGETRALTAEALMRSRYAAYAVGDLDHIYRTWHPGTRPDDPRLQPGIAWVGLEIIDVVGGAEGDADGVVEFEARFIAETGADVLHERSTFERRAGSWVYVTAVPPNVAPPPMACGPHS